jgi:hypothetical protein
MFDRTPGVIPRHVELGRIPWTETKPLEILDFSALSRPCVLLFLATHTGGRPRGRLQRVIEPRLVGDTTFPHDQTIVLEIFSRAGSIRASGIPDITSEDGLLLAHRLKDLGIDLVDTMLGSDSLDEEATELSLRLQ